MVKPTPAQQEAIETLDCNVSVSAGAGSGKTRVLVERFLEIVAQKKAGADGILAITFTRKAAKEMKERLRSGFLERLKTAQGSDRDFWQEQLNYLENAQITTIDSFCSKVLRENPVEANLDPNFTVREEYELEIFKQEVLDSFVDRSLQESEGNFLLLLQEYGYRPLVATLIQLLDDLKEVLKEDFLPKLAQAVKNEEELWQEACSCYENLLNEKEKAGPTTKTMLLSWQEEGEDFYPRAKAQPNLMWQRASAVSKSNKKLAGEIDALREAAKAYLQNIYDIKAVHLGEAWQEVLRSLATFYQQEIIRREYYSFTFLSAQAVKILGSCKQVLAKYRAKYKFIMVDEFQDTNEEQRELVYLLAGGNRDKLLGDRLFVVGDGKQSIYRFRGADVSVFKRVREAIASTGGKNIVLADNYRSTPEIMNSCNCLFRDLLGTNEESDVSAQDLTAHREGGEKPLVEVIINENSSGAVAREAEANLIASKLKEIVTHDPEINYGDMAILVPAIDLGPRFIRALSQVGIPAILTDGKGFYDRQEITDVYNFFSFCFNTRKDFSLVGILRSPYFALDDELLTQIFLSKKEGTLWGKMQALSEPRVKECCLILAKLIQTAQSLSLVEWWEEFYTLLQVEPLLLAQRQGAEKFANVQKLRSMAVDFAMKEGGTGREFFQRLTTLRNANAREQAASVVREKAAVNIMTIHKSKGLEFPVVVLPSLWRTGHSDSELYRFSPLIGFGFKVPDNKGVLQETTVFLQAKEKLAQLERAEKIRQLYVAMTRAEKYLLLTAVKTVTKSKRQITEEKWFDSIERVFQYSENDHLVNWQEYAPEEIKVPLAIAQQGKTVTVPEETYLHIKPVCEGKPQMIFSATSLGEYDSCPRRFYYKYLAMMPTKEEEQIGTKGYYLSPQILGLIVHRALELKREISLEDALQRAVLEQDFSGSESEKYTQVAQEMLTGYLDSPLARAVEELPREAEKEFSLELFPLEEGRAVFTGSIDCLLHYPDGSLGIVDYKTGRPPNKGEEKEAYTRQLLLYALAAEKIYGARVQTCQLHFLQNNSLWSLPENRQEEIIKLRSLMQELLQKEKEQDYKVLPNNCPYCPYNYFCKKV